MTPPIKIYISPNETVTGKERIAAMQPYLLRHVDEFEVHRDKERGSDLVFVSQSYTEELSPLGGVLRTKYHPKKYLAVELKMPLDYANSCQNGHMATQRRDSQHPLVVWVLGSPGDVMRSLGNVGPNGLRKYDEKIKDKAMIERFTAKLRASGIDVRFGWSPQDYLIDFSMGYRPEHWEGAVKDALEANMAQVLREAKAYLESDYHLPMPKCENTQEAMLQCLPRVGPKTAKDLLDGGFKLHLRSPNWGNITTKTEEEELMEIPNIGKVTAQKIMEAMR